MYLKEIKISGFKSFADKININLDNNITCIVGPNGSGKSNIVDAVKWVMGEQSVKSLRGNNTMTDVIFSGSSSRNPLNIASVSLVFDNSDNCLKNNMDEVSITRKVYRSGESEYYINNEQCRLKDISDLFLDTGVGKYAFNIISQGEVSKIISDSPSERRLIFEEAANVLKYKKRKEEALRKLDKTNENLVRVNDIVSELETQIEPLKDQSEKAKEYLSYKDELEDLEISLIANDLGDLNNDYNSLQKEIDNLNNEIISFNAGSSSSDAEILKKQEELTLANENIASLNNKFLSLSKEEERLNGEKNIIKERSKYDATDSKVHENIANLKEQQLSINNRMISLKTDKEIIEKKIEALNNDILLARQNLNNTIKERSEMEVDISSKNKELTDISYKIKTLSSYIEQGGDMPVSVRKVLSNPRIHGMHNTISRLINFDLKYSNAIEVALGGAKNYVVVESPEVAKNAINYLKENNIGRVTFFPITAIKPRFVETDILNLLSNDNGFIDVLANKLSFSETYKNIIFNQLGNVLLVDNIDSANRISKLINNRYKIVTLEGEVINVGGSITGGSLNKNSVISEKYELQNLNQREKNVKEELSYLEEKVNEVINNEKQKQVSIIELEKQKLLLNEELSSKRSVFDSLKNDYERITLELNNLKSLTNDTLQEEEDKIIIKYYEVINEKELVSKQIVEAESAKNDISSAIERLQADYRFNNSKSKELGDKLRLFEVKSTKISVKMDNLLNILNGTYNLTFEKAKENYVLDIDHDIATKSVNELKSKIKALGVINIGAIEEYDRINARYEFLIKQKNDLTGAIEILSKIISELDKVMEEEFLTTFKNIEVEFNNVFKALFGGGSASLKLTDKDNLLETGIDIVVAPPGKKISTITLLSGGEKTLTAISLLFAVLNVKKIPFCIFDEIEAALDEANVERIGNYFEKYVGKTQLIIITHKKKTMEYANTLYGITMQESGVSKLVSVKLVDKK